MTFRVGLVANENLASEELAPGRIRQHKSASQGMNILHNYETPRYRNEQSLSRAHRSA